MGKSLSFLWSTCALSLCFLLVGGIWLLGQTVPLKTLPVKFDEDYGAAIARIGEGRLHQMDTTLVELPPGGQLAPHKHLAEELIYIVSGKGYTTMWREGATSRAERYDWAAGDVLSPSLNVWHEHVNASSTEPARFLSMTSTPLTKNLFGNAAEFVSSSDFVFEDRWNKGAQQKKPEFVDGEWGGSPDALVMAVGHHFPDMINVKLMPREGNNSSGLNVRPSGDEGPSMAGNRLFEWQNREWESPGFTHYHRHPWEVVYVCIKGEMHSKITRVADPVEGKLEPERKLSWKEGDLMIVEANEYHSLGSSLIGTRFLQFKVSGYFRRVGIDPWLMRDLIEEEE